MPSYNIPISVDFEFELKCDRCGNALDSFEHTAPSGTVYRIDPCEKCRESFEQEAYDRGYDQGNEEGFKDGHTEGYKEGHADGYESGKEDAEPT